MRGALVRSVPRPTASVPLDPDSPYPDSPHLARSTEPRQAALDSRVRAAPLPPIDRPTDRRIEGARRPRSHA